jgi:hypothetical protein
MKKPPRPLASRVKAAAALLLVEGLFLGIVGAFFVWLPSPDWRPWTAQMGARLPPKSSLTRVEGRVVAIERHSTRRSHFERPKVEFSVAGQPYHVRAVSSYSTGLQPFVNHDQPASVLYSPARPQEAWLEWEYDRFIASMDSTPAKMADFLERAKAGYWRFALWVLGLSVLVFAVLLFR